MHLALYNDVVVFDHATKLAYVIAWVHVDEHPDVDAAYQVLRTRTPAQVLCTAEETEEGGAHSARLFDGCQQPGGIASGCCAGKGRCDMCAATFLADERLVILHR